MKILILISIFFSFSNALFIENKELEKQYYERVVFFNTEIENIKKIEDKELQLKKINSLFNKYITYTSDEELYGKRDFIAPFNITIKTLKGDCDDFVIAKLEALKYLDFKSYNILYDKIDNNWHVKLVVFVENKAFVLDSANKNFRKYEKEGLFFFKGNTFDIVASSTKKIN